jgi:hypothetical protein
MESASRRSEYELLARELEGEQYVALLRELQGRAPLFREFESWQDVIGLMRAGMSRDPKKDAVLLRILQAHARDGDARWRTVALAIFWPGIESVCKRKGRWDTDKDRLWANAVWAFLQAVCKLDIVRRTDHLVSRIISGTIHRLHDEYSREWCCADREIPTDPDELDGWEGSGEDEIICTVDLHLWQEAKIAQFRGHMELGLINEADFHLLVATRVYGKSAAQYADEVGMSGAVARKRRQRAEALIREFEEKTGRNASRSPGPEPPFAL